MNKTIIISVSIIVVLAIFVTLLLSLNTITGRFIDESINDFTFTKAICDDSNYCQDYEIKCSEGKTVSINPITGAVVQHSPSWEDPRTKEQIEKLCD